MEQAADSALASGKCIETNSEEHMESTNTQQEKTNSRELPKRDEKFPSFERKKKKAKKMNRGPFLIKTADANSVTSTKWVETNSEKLMKSIITKQRIAILRELAKHERVVDEIFDGPSFEMKKKKAQNLSKETGMITSEIQKDPPKKEVAPDLIGAETQLSTGIPSTASTYLDISNDLVHAVMRVIKELHYEKYAGKTLLVDRMKVFVVIGLVRVPIVDRGTRRTIRLPHCIYDKPETCLFVKNRRSTDRVARGTDERIDYTIDYYENFLKQHKISEKISSIIPVRQLMTEYNTYEMKRRLAHKFDIFMCDAKLHRVGNFTNAFGNVFRAANKFPLPVDFPVENSISKFLKGIDKAINSTSYMINPHSSMYAICVGHVAQDIALLTENVMAVLKRLNDKGMIPGGLPNMGGVYLKSEGNHIIPLYINLASKNMVEPPVVESPSTVPKKNREAVEGELSTMPGVRVTVLPSGDVFTTKDSDEDWDSEGGSESEEDENVKKRDKKAEKKQDRSKEKNSQEEGDEDDSEEENGITDASEMLYLKDWAQAADMEDEEDAGTKQLAGAVKSKIKKSKSKNKRKIQATPTHSNDVKGEKRKKSDTKQGGGKEKKKKKKSLT